MGKDLKRNFTNKSEWPKNILKIAMKGYVNLKYTKDINLFLQINKEKLSLTNPH